MSGFTEVLNTVAMWRTWNRFSQIPLRKSKLFSLKNMINIPEIQYITRDDSTYSHSEQAKMMFENGIKWVQIRMKNAAVSDVLEQSAKAMEYARQFHGT